MPHSLLASTLAPCLVASVVLAFSAATGPMDTMVKVYCSENSNLIIIVNKIAQILCTV